jgi:hypothetical protein
VGAALKVYARYESISVEPGGSARVDFAVGNVGDAVARVRIEVVALPPTPREWLAIEGGIEAAIQPGSGTRVIVVAAVPPGAETGTYRFRVDAFDADRPEEVWTHGSVVTLSVVGRVTAPAGSLPGSSDPGRDSAKIVCPQCGTPNPGERRFCSTCGMVLQSAGATITNATSQAPVEAIPPPAVALPEAPPPPPRSAPGVGSVIGGIGEAVVVGVGALLGALRRGKPDQAERTIRVTPGAKFEVSGGQRIERHTSATFPAEVEAGATATLRFSIGTLLAGGVKGFVSVEAPVGVSKLDLVATVHAPAFEIVSPEPRGAGQAPTVAMPLDLTNPLWSVRGEFVLRAKPTDSPTDTTILLDFWYQASPVGQTRIKTRIVPKGVAAGAEAPQSRPSVGEFRVSAQAPPPAEVTLFITDEGGGRYQIQATTPNVFMRDLGEFPAGQNAWSYSAAMLSRFRDASNLPEQARLDRVVGLGLDLWRNLPAAFHDFYWQELYGKDRSIAIYSQEPYIPWELIRPPAEDGRAPDFLGSEFRVARWRNGRLFPDPLKVSDFVVIAPEYTDQPLVETVFEAADLEKRFGARLVDGRYDPVAASLKSKDVQLVHFAGHGEFDEGAPQQSRIRLRDQAILPTDVRTFRQGLGKGPFVFLNACEVGEQGWVFTGIGGWADTFCDVGCTGFVGPYWAVDDQVAHAAALRFYDGLANGRTVGEAIRDVRRAFDDPGPFRHHPTWLAYSLHCQPNIRIELAH